MTSRIAAVVASTFLLVLFVAGQADAAFPGNNGKIAFVSQRTGNYDIYTMNADGGDVTAVTDDAAIDLLPAWSPDGTEIAFTSNRGGGTGNVWVMNADGSGMTQLTELGNVGKAEWSPDGTQIAFDQEGALWTVDADGTNFSRLDSSSCDDLTLHCTYFGWPSWSPDGTRIDYVGNEADDEGMSVQSDIWSIPLTAGIHVNVTSTSTVYENRPDWSPDGSKIAIDSSLPFSGSQIWVMDPNGGNRVQLTTDPVTASGPAWSPDRAKIAFDSYRDGNYEVYLMNADGSGQTNLTRNGATDFEADWQSTQGPQRSDYQNGAQFCKAEHDFLGDAAFRQKYGGGAGAYGKCVSVK